MVPLFYLNLDLRFHFVEDEPIKEIVQHANCKVLVEGTIFLNWVPH